MGTGAWLGFPGAIVDLLQATPLGSPYAAQKAVYVDTLAGDIFLEADDDVRRYRQMFDYLRAGALSPADSAKLISSIVEGWK